MENLSNLGIDIGSIIFYLVNFGLIFYLVKKYLTKPAINLLDKRSKEIEDNIKSSQKLKKQLELEQKKLAQFKLDTQQNLTKELAQARQELEQKEKERMQEIQDLKDEILNKARSQAKREREQVIESIKEDIVKITKQAFYEITKKSVSEDEVLQSVTKVINESNKSN